VLFLSKDKALALLSALQVSLPKVREEILDSNYDPDSVELYGYLNSIYDDILIQLAQKRGEQHV